MGITFPEDWHNSSALVFYVKLYLRISLKYIQQARWTIAALSKVSPTQGATCEDVNLCINDMCGFLEMCMWHLQLCRRRRRCPHRLSSFLKMLKNKISVNVRPAPKLRMAGETSGRSHRIC